MSDRKNGLARLVGALVLGGALALLVVVATDPLPRFARELVRSWRSERLTTRQGARPAAPEVGRVLRVEPEVEHGTRTHLERTARPFEARFFTQRLRIEGSVTGPVAQLRRHATYVNHQPWPRAGGEVVEHLQFPRITALHDLWITEHGVRIHGKVRAASQARADYDATVRKARDPGLLEWVAQGRARFSIFPVLTSGRPKEAHWRQDSLLEPDPEGWVQLALDGSSLPTRGLSVELEVRDPRGIRAWQLPGGFEGEEVEGGGLRITAELVDLEHAPADLLLRWQLGVAPPRVQPEDAQVRAQVVDLGEGRWVAQAVGPFFGPDPQAVHLLGRSAGPAPATLGEVRTRWGPARLVSANQAEAPAGLGSGPVSVPRGTWQRLRAAAEVAAHWYSDAEDHRQADARVAVLARQYRIVTPLSSLYAKPGQVAEAPSWISGDPLEAEAARQRQPAASRTSFEMGPGFLLVPNFKAARQRANIRACFANQKTLAGAVEMYNLDFNTNALVEFGGAGASSLRPTGGVPCRLSDATLGLRVRPAPGLDAQGAQGHEFQRWPEGGGQVPWVSFHALFPTLVEQGYLNSAPRDPGGDPQEVAQYLLLDAGATARSEHARRLAASGVFCLRHGTLASSGRVSARQQLKAMGVEDPGLLRAASDEVDRGIGGRRVRLFHGGEFEMWLALLALATMLQMGRVCPRTQRLGAGLTGLLGTLLFLGLALRSAPTIAALRWLTSATCLLSPAWMFLQLGRSIPDLLTTEGSPR